MDSVRKDRRFYEARFALVRARLNPVNVAKFDHSSYEQKVKIVEGLLSKGALT